MSVCPCVCTLVSPCQCPESLCLLGIYILESLPVYNDSWVGSCVRWCVCV